ncbi:MAG TPA: methyltransferase domain-containing protein [Steroidobacteraceae bacterium]|nr:methyltransferase domain-containing protein [Steroidobacteraceae bacterium]
MNSAASRPASELRTHWLSTQLGQRVHALECKLVAEALTQVFGWQLLQIGTWGQTHALMDASRTQRKAVLSPDALNEMPGVMTIRSRTDSLAIASDTVDAVLLPHTLEHTADPHELLREVERILPGDGQLIILGFRPFSLWGTRNLFGVQGFPPGTERFIGERRLRDWLKLLGFEVTDARRYLFTLPWGGAVPRSQRLLEAVGIHAWPLLAGAYMLTARKRVYTLTPIRPRWRIRQRVVGGLIEPTTRVPQPHLQQGASAISNPSNQDE